MSPQAIDSAAVQGHAVYHQRGGAAVRGQQFARLLDNYTSDLASANIRFSSHATARMERRGIQMTDGLQGQLLSGFRSLAEKGSKDGLVVIDNNRFLVSVPNRTVITAMTAQEKNIYTNIDGVVFV